MGAAVMELWRKEPAVFVGAVIAFVDAVLTLLVVFAVPITPEQKTAIVGVITTLLVLVGAVVTRNQVYAPATVEDVKSMAFLEGHREGVATARLRTPIVQGDNVESVSGA